MFWNKKESDEGLPDLPPLKGKRPINPNEHKSTLPSFPDVPSQKGFTQSAIKDAVNNSKESNDMYEEEHERSLPPVPGQNIKAIEMEEWTPSQQIDEDEHVMTLPEPKQIPMPKPIEKTPTMQQAPRVRESIPSPSEIPETTTRIRAPAQDIFVKIDKFRSVRKTLEETSTKLEEIDEMLKKIKEIKMREEQELENWEREISNARGRIHEINSQIFEKVN